MIRFATLLTALILASPICAETIETSAGPVTLDRVVTGLDEPWAVGFLPDGGLMITERDGRLLLVRDGEKTEVSGLPEVAASGQGGLLDVLVSSDFAETRTLFFSYAKPQRLGATGTALMRAELNEEGTALENVQDIFELTEGSTGGRHFGSRIVEAPDGTLFLTIGDRGNRMSAQDLQSENGTVVRVAKDGTIPDDNPFVDIGQAMPAIWSFGHRNPQGATLDLEGNLLVVEHGAQGGDEINRVSRGANYGWPIIAYGQHYGGGRIGEGTARDDMEQPAFYWDPSMAPSGMMVYSGALWPEWEGDIFVGSLKFDYIARLDGEPLAEVEQIQSEQTLRVRDVREGPDGAIWFLSVGEGALFRMTPGT